MELLELLSALGSIVRHPIRALKRGVMLAVAVPVGCGTLAVVTAISLGVGSLIGSDTEVAGGVALVGFLGGFVVAPLAVLFVWRRVPENWRPSADKPPATPTDPLGSLPAPVVPPEVMMSRVAELDRRFAPPSASTPDDPGAGTSGDRR